MCKFEMTRRALVGSVVVMLTSLSTIAQPQIPQPSPPQTLPVQAPVGFQLNQLEQTYLDEVLAAWQRESGKIITFQCDFQRLEYNVAFGPGPNIPLNVNKGQISYHRPDKGSFQITEIKTFQAKPVPPGQPMPEQIEGDWVKQANAVGEHWVCDGKAVYEYRHDQKQLVERPIPPHLQGQAIADGPLPFLFGAEPAKLKQRYWMRIEQQLNKDPNVIWIVAQPKGQAQAADFSKVEVMLDRQRLLPTAMQVHLPNGSRHVYIFDIANAEVNSPLARITAMFQRPRVPRGWQRVVEEMPVQQAAQPNALPQ
jgi:TIGR03009 family protein